MKNNQAFTLIELIIVIAIIGILSAVILFSIMEYINKGKDVSIRGNLATLVTAGETYYNKYNTYDGFCSSAAAQNSISQIPLPSSASQVKCLHLDNEWVACSQKFQKQGGQDMAFCVDSTASEKEITNSACADITVDAAVCP